MYRRFPGIVNQFVVNDIARAGRAWCKLFVLLTGGLEIFHPSYTEAADICTVLQFSPHGCSSSQSPSSNSTNEIYMTLLLVGVEGAALLGVDELVPIGVSCQHDFLSLETQLENTSPYACSLVTLPLL